MALEQETLLIRVGAVADASLRTIGRDFGAAMEKASRASRKASGDNANAEAAALAQIMKANERVAAQKRALLNRMQADEDRAAAKDQARADRNAQKRVRSDLRAFDERIKASAKAAAAEERDIAKVLAASERATAKKAKTAQREAETATKSFRQDFSRRAVDNVGAVARGGLSIAGQLTRGMGVDLSLTSALQRNNAFQKTAANITLSDAAGRGTTANVGDIDSTMNAIRSAGDASAQDYGKLAAGMESFVAKSSDLATAKKTLADIGLIARATGTEVDELASAAGDVNKFLKDSPNRADDLLGVLRVVAKQGAMGTVEIKDLATYMGRMVAFSNRFNISKTDAMAQLGAIAQTATMGGRVTSAEATMSAMSLGRDIMKPRTLKNLKEDFDINPFADKGNTKLKSPQALIKEMVAKSGGDLSKLTKMLPNENSRAALMAFADISNQAGGGKAGLDAIDKEFARFTQGMSKSDIDKQAAVSMSTNEAKAQKFQNQLDRIASSLAERLLPAMERLAPVALQAAEGLARMLSFAVENPGTAITAAIVASIGRAAVGASISAALTSALNPATGGASAAAASLGGLAAGAILLAGVFGAMYLADQKQQEKQFAEERAGERKTTDQLIADARAGKGDPEMLKQLEDRANFVKGQQITAQMRMNDPDAGGWGGVGGESSVRGQLSSNWVGNSLEQAKEMGKLGTQLAELQAAIASLKSGGFKVSGNVTVDNMPPGGLAPAGGGGRTGP